MQTLLLELTRFVSRIGTTRSVLLHLLLLLAFGVWIPRSKGPDFLDSQVLAAYVCLGLIFAGPATAQCFTETFAPSYRTALSRIVVGVLYGELAVAALTGAGIGTVYFNLRGRYVPAPDWPAVGKSALFGLVAAAIVASMAAWVTVRFSRRIAMISLRLIFFGLLVLFFYKGQYLAEIGPAPIGWGIGFVGLFAGLLGRTCRSSPYPTT